MSPKSNGYGHIAHGQCEFKTVGTGTMTVKSLENIYGGFAPAEVLMSDGGKHFKK